MTDHRAQAAGFLESAHALHNGADTSERAITCALIGIGHALLALDLGPPRLLDLGNEPLSTEEADALKAQFLSHYPDKA